MFISHFNSYACLCSLKSSFLLRLEFIHILAAYIQFNSHFCIYLDFTILHIFSVFFLHFCFYAALFINLLVLSFIHVVACTQFYSYLHIYSVLFNFLHLLCFALFFLHSVIFICLIIFSFIHNFLLIFSLLIFLLDIKFHSHAHSWFGYIQFFQKFF